MARHSNMCPDDVPLGRTLAFRTMVQINGKDLLPCFDDRGLLVDDLVPCMPDGNASACCPAGSQCAANVLCLVVNGSSVPGGCTDGSLGSWGTSDGGACPCRPRVHDLPALPYLRMLK